jgi:hypothetical protein
MGQDGYHIHTPTRGSNRGELLVFVYRSAANAKELLEALDPANRFGWK